MYAYVRIPIRVASSVVTNQDGFCETIGPAKKVMRLTPLSDICPHGLLNHVNVVLKFYRLQLCVGVVRVLHGRRHPQDDSQDGSQDDLKRLHKEPIFA